VDPVVFLDRDNTLIANDGDLGDPAKVRLLPGVAEGLKRLKDAGYRLVVVTNQGGVARGRYGEADVDRVHARIAQMIDEESGGKRVLDRFYYCPFHPEGTHPDYRREHPWRKPRPGMLLQAAADLALDLDRGWVIGDQARDIIAGKAAGVRTILLGEDETTIQASNPEFVVREFVDAVDTVLWHRMNDAAEVTLRIAERTRSRAALEIEMKPATEAHATAVATVSEAADRRARSARAERKNNAQRKERREEAHRGGRGAKSALEPLRRALVELVEEVRTDRTRRGEFGPLRIVAAATQLLTIVLAVFALLELADITLFARWMGGALLAQLATIALLLFDGR
jgi:D-glycero-D-manno-heptose 1,7-bisphosphate phosphatase